MDLVTGGAGFIGSHLTEKLIELGNKVIVVDNLSSGSQKNIQHLIDKRKIEFIEADITNVATMKSIMEKGVDRIFHLAALADIVPSINFPEKYYKSNVEGTFIMCNLAREYNVQRFVYVASSSCYGVPDHFPTKETDDVSPQYPYALTKWMGENLVMHWCKVYKVPAVSLRFFNIYGPRARTNGTYGAVFGVFLAQLLSGQPLTIVGDGKQKRDFTYVADAVKALIVAANSSLTGEIMNVGSDNPISINYLIKLLGAPNTVFVPKRPGEPACTWADTTKIKKFLKWHAEVSIEEGVKYMLENINYWREAPVWTPQAIEHATLDWFKYIK